MKSIASIISVIITLTIISCNHDKSLAEKESIRHQKPKQLVNNKTIYEFLNYNFTHKDSAFLDCENIIEQEWLPYFFTHEDSLTLLEMGTIFTKEDIDFIFRQATYARYFKLKQTELPNKNIIKIDTFKVYNNNREIRGAYLDDLYKKHGSLCTLKMPLFSIDRKTVYISIGLTCGTLCGAGGTYIYRKVNKKWVLIKTLNEWVS